MRLSSYEIDVLRALASGGDPVLSSNHRLRFELLGLVRETPSGVLLTKLGEQSLDLRPSIAHETLEPSERRLDILGRRLGARSYPGAAGMTAGPRASPVLVRDKCNSLLCRGLTLRLHTKP